MDVHHTAGQTPISKIPQPTQDRLGRTLLSREPQFPDWDSVHLHRRPTPERRRRKPPPEFLSLQSYSHSCFSCLLLLFIFIDRHFRRCNRASVKREFHRSALHRSAATTKSLLRLSLSLLYCFLG